MMLRRKNNFLQWFLEPFVMNRRGFGHQPDFVFLITVAILLFLGLLFLSSASANLGFYKYDDTYRFLKQQIIHGLLPGLLFFYLAVRINYQHYRNLAWLGLIVSFILLILVFLTSLSGDFSAQSWIILGGISFQPAELVKLLLIIFLAFWFEKKGAEVKDFKKTTLPFLIIIGLISFLIIKQPDIGTLSIIGTTALAMYYVAGAKFSHLSGIIAAGIFGLLLMIKAAPYRMNRIVAWLNSDVDPQGIGWQIKQSLIAVGSGGWFGLGLGSSRQKSYLPQPANDSIFAVISEEIGFLFTLGLVILFIILIYRGFQIARQSDDDFAKLLSIGIIAWLALQIFINIAGMIKLMPLTGVPLPFMSLGGSNLVVTLIAVGILTNISKFTHSR